jgi:hypothetical protein
MPREPSKQQTNLPEKIRENDKSLLKAEPSSSRRRLSKKPGSSRRGQSLTNTSKKNKPASKIQKSAKSNPYKGKGKELPPTNKVKTSVKKFAEVFRVQLGTFVNLFLDPRASFDDIAKALNLIDKNYRDKFTKMKPDAECQTAASAAQGLEPNPARQANVAPYLNLAARSRANNTQPAIDKANTIGQQPGYKRIGNGFNRNGLPTAVQMVQATDIAGNTVIHIDRNGNKRNKQTMTVSPFGFQSMMDCGVCHLCGQSVYAYGNNDFITGCGECEHIGAILASLFAGMLASQGDPSMAYGYGLSHVQCNQAKSDLLSVKFNIKDLRWEYDIDGAKKIIDRILDGFGGGQGALHKAEYCPEYAKWWNEARKPLKRKQTISKMLESIKRHSDAWCSAANTRLNVSAVVKIKTVKDAVSGITRILEKMITSVSGGTRFGQGNFQQRLGDYEQKDDVNPISDSGSSSPASCIGDDCPAVSQSQGLGPDMLYSYSSVATESPERMDLDSSDTKTCPEGAVCESSIDSGDIDYIESMEVAFDQVKHPSGSAFDLLLGDKLLDALRADATVQTLIVSLRDSMLLNQGFSFVTGEIDDKYFDGRISVRRATSESSTEDMESSASVSDASLSGYLASQSESEGSDMEGGSRAFHWKTMKKYNRIVRKRKQYTKKIQ